MPGHYNLNPADFNNKWDLVFKLEGSKDLEESNIKRMEYFAKLLDEDAKRIFLQTGKAPAKASAQQTTHTPARTIGQALTQTTAQVTQASAKQTQASAAGISQDDYRILNVKFSTWCDDRRHEGLFNRLKCTYSDLLDNATFSRINKDKNTIDLLNALHAAGKLSRNNLKLLHDTITITNQIGLREELENLLPPLSNEEISSFTQHRQGVLKFFSTLSDKDVDRINARFNDPIKQYSDRWDMLFDLEKCRGIIDEVKWNKFIEDLEKIGLKASASKGIRKRKRSTTSEEADEGDNSGHSSDDSRQASTAKQKRKGGPRKPGTKSKDEKKQIMISYKHNCTKVNVATIVKVLEEKLKESHTFWIDEQDITGNMIEDIEREITGSSIVLICLSKEYEKSKYCKKECQIIREEKIPFVTLRMEDYEPEKDSEVQEMVKGRRYIDFSDETMFTKKNYNKLVQCIKENEKN